MKILIFISLLFSLNTFASNAPWQDLFTEEGLLVLTQPLVLYGSEGQEIHVAPNQTFTLESASPIEGISVVDFFLRETNCKHPDLESDLTIILPAENSPSSKAEVGVYYNKGCSLEIFVESKDLARPSFFKFMKRHR